MNVRLRVFGKFDRVGWQQVEDKVVEVPAVVPVRWTLKVFGFIKVTIVGRVEIEPAPPSPPV